MKNLTKLSITNSKIKSLEDLVFFPNLEILNLDMCNNLKNITGIENCQKLTDFSSITCGIVDDYSPLEDITTLKNFVLQNSKLDSLKQLISSLKNSNIESLTLQNLGLEDAYCIQEIVNVKKLNLAYNNIVNIDFIANLKELTYLNLNGNNINDFLSLSELDNLNELYLKGNSDIKGNRESYNQENLQKLQKIEKILEKGGKIILDSDKLRLFTKYKSLDLSNENLVNIEILKNMDELEELKLSNNKLTFNKDEDKDILKNMTKLKHLDLSFNYIKDISFLNNLTNLKTLNIYGDNNSTINLQQVEDIISNLDLTITNEQIQTLSNCDNKKNI